ncbi:hypothetical protein [Porphyrobacter sp. HT-58-2]|uniref:hypothetical protein n=1 Tax=Porphyrobacter sp. HT-58-2 TaxID=2023229 RepID=UPI0011B069C5|nr:hypothetical protein [Porphyrobacter sp. HT-58-2]
MTANIKAVLGIILFAVWGPYLLYVWMMPGAVPGWVTAPGMRRALMLSREFEPTVFTLGFGLTFTALVFVGIYRLATGQIPDQQG